MLKGIVVVFTRGMVNRTANKQLFSRLSALRKRKEADPVTVEEEENITEDHSFEQNLRCEVYEALDLQHPLSFEDRNICKISKGGKSWN